MFDDEPDYNEPPDNWQSCRHCYGSGTVTIGGRWEPAEEVDCNMCGGSGGHCADLDGPEPDWDGPY